LTDGEEAARQISEGEVLDAPERQIAGEVQQLQVRSSPYPAPDELRQYEELLPGFTERILALTERESAHRIQDEQSQTHAIIALAKRGQTYAFIVVLALIGVGGAGILSGHSVVGLAGIIAAAATVVTAFVAPNLFDRIRKRTSKSNQGELPTGNDSEPAS